MDLTRSFLTNLSYSIRIFPYLSRRPHASYQALRFVPSCTRLHHSLTRAFASSSTMPKKKNKHKTSGKYTSSVEIAKIGNPADNWNSQSYTTTIDGGLTSAEVNNIDHRENHLTSPKSIEKLTDLFKGHLLDSFAVDNSVYARAQIRATFYPKFENEKSDQEVRLRMIEMVSKGLATLEVTLKHSGSLFMYAGSKGGAYAKNSFGNLYTAVGVFVLGRMFREAWGNLAETKQSEFNDFLEKNRMSVATELVTAVLGDHGQRPKMDYAVVTAVTELGKGKPKFYSTPEVISFCRKWRLPTNNVWLFSERKSVTSFFAAYDALCEEGTATTVCRALDEIADLSFPGSIDHVKVQGEILEGLVARTVTHESLKHMEDMMKEHSSPPVDGVDSGPTLREICAANRSNETLQIKALLQVTGPAFCPNHSDWFRTELGQSHSRSDDKSVIAKFLKANPADFSTSKLQEMIRLLRERHFQAGFKCYYNVQKMDSISSDSLFYRMVIHVYNDSVFRRYQREMRQKPCLWPLYRGFFVDIDLIKTDNEKLGDTGSTNFVGESLNESSTESGSADFADDSTNMMMIKLKFLTYKLRTFLIRNGLSILFKNGPTAYKEYYSRQLRTWGTSLEKQKALEIMLDEWAVHVLRKCGKKQLSASVYLSEAEPFLEKYASRSPQNQALVGSAGSFVNAEDFLAVMENSENDDLVPEELSTPSSSPMKETVQKEAGLLVFFPGIPGCAKSALCKELVNSHELFGVKRDVFSLMGDLTKGKYWQKVADEHRKRPHSILLADKNAPNEQVWRQIQDMSRRNNVSAVPVVPDSEGSVSNPFSLDALAVFVFRVLQRVNHPGNLDKASPNAGYVLLMFYNLYAGKNRHDFDAELVERFGFLVKMPLLRSDRNPLPDPLRSILEEGLSLFELHSNRHGRLDSTKGDYAHEWSKWEKRLRETFFLHSKYLNSIQVPFDTAVNRVTEQLKSISTGDYTTPISEKRKFGSIVYAAIELPSSEVFNLLENLSEENSNVEALMNDKDVMRKLKSAHVTLAHKRSHGVAAVANYGHLLHQFVPVSLTALLFTERMAAFEAHLGSVDGEQVVAKNQWPHVTLWTAEGVTAKEANVLPQLYSEGKAIRVGISPPFTVSGPLKFF